MKVSAEIKTSDFAEEQAQPRSKAADYLELTKPRISAMVLVTTLAGFYMASAGSMEYVLLLHALFGTALVGSGASALNQIIERRADSLMDRTRNRPLPTGRVGIAEAMVFSIGIGGAGVLYLGLFTNILAALVAATTLVLYVAVYTPLKRRTYLNTIIGAVPGALPPIIGWAAATGSLPMPAWTLFTILFFWQLPHFYAIAWLYREDYARGGFKMISTDDPLGERISVRVFGQILALVAASLTPSLWGLTGRGYFFVALGLGVIFLICGLNMGKMKSKGSARALLLVSVIYLPLLLAAMMVSRVL